MQRTHFDSPNRVPREISRGTVARDSSRPPGDHPSVALHKEIAAAIEAHEPEAANLTMRHHLQSVASRLIGDL